MIEPSGITADGHVWAFEQLRSRLAQEAQTRARLEAGELGVDFYGLRAKLLEMGVEYVDRA